MANTTTFSAQVKNVALDGIRGYEASGQALFQISVLSADSDEAVIASSPTFNYASPSGGAMALSANVVINVPASNTVTHISIHKNTYPNMFRISTTALDSSETFTYAGSITITSATITISDEV